MVTSTDRSLYHWWWRFDLWRFFLSSPSSLIYMHATRSCTYLMFFLFFFSVDLLLIACSLPQEEELNFSIYYLLHVTGRVGLIALFLRYFWFVHSLIACYVGVLIIHCVICDCACLILFAMCYVSLYCSYVCLILITMLLTDHNSNLHQHSG